MLIRLYTVDELQKVFGLQNVDAFEMKFIITKINQKTLN